MQKKRYSKLFCVRLAEKYYIHTTQAQLDDFGALNENILIKKHSRPARHYIFIVLQRE